MTVCKFFLEGRCNFGSGCRNEHPGDAQQRNNHRFGATDSNNPLRGRIGFPSSSTDYTPGKIYDERSVRADLSKDRPEYRYSAYGPAKEEPNLLEGTDFSAEELRVQYYNIMSTSGVDTAYHAGVKDLDERMQGQIDTILRDLRHALNRFDVKRQQLAQQQAASGFGAFGQPPQPQHQPEPQRQGAYGSPSVLGAPAPSATPSPFGSTINQPNQPSTPSLLGSSYNQPTAATPSLFGSNPSGFGASTFGGNGSLSYPGAQAQAQPQPSGSIFSGGLGGFQPQQQQPDPQQQYLLQMQQQQELLAQQQQQQQMLQQQMLQQQQMQQQQPQQPGNTQGTINNPQMQPFASNEFELYKIPEIPPPSGYRR